MKYVLILLVSVMVLLAQEKSGNLEKEKKVEAQIKEQIKKEKKYAKEQKFYTEDNYDYKGAEVNKESLKSVPELEPDYDFNMDSVYD